MRGRAVVTSNSASFDLAPGTAVYIPPGSVYQIENTSDDRSDGDLEVNSDLEVIGVCCPEDDTPESKPAPVAKTSSDISRFRAVREQDQPPIATGDRTFKLLINQATGCKRVTQFIGVFPPGRAGSQHPLTKKRLHSRRRRARVD